MIGDFSRYDNFKNYLTLTYMKQLHYTDASQTYDQNLLARSLEDPDPPFGTTSLSSTMPYCLRHHWHITTLIDFLLVATRSVSHASVFRFDSTSAVLKSPLHLSF